MTARRAVIFVIVLGALAAWIAAAATTSGQLFLVKEGEEVTVAGLRYHVSRISADSADLSASDETTLHLALK